MSNAAITTSKQGRNSWSFDYQDPRGGCMEVALIGGKVKARRVFTWLQSQDLSGKHWESVALMIKKFREDNNLTFGAPHPRGA